MESGREHPKRPFGIFLTVTILLFGLSYALLLGYLKKEEMNQKFLSFISQKLEDAFGLSIVVEGVESNVFGYVQVNGLRARSDPQTPDSTFLIAKELVFRYRLWDFVRGDFTGGVKILIRDPVLYTDVPIRITQKPGVQMKAKFLELASRLIAQLTPRSSVVVRNARFARRRPYRVWTTMDGEFGSKGFDARFQLEHFLLENIDISSEIIVAGSMLSDAGVHGTQFALDVQTQRSVINLKPVSDESRLSIQWSQDDLRVLKADLVGGLRLDGVVGLRGEGDLQLGLYAKAYPLANLDAFLDRTPDERISGRLDAQLKITGPLVQPHIQGEILLRESRMGETSFKNIQLTVAGVLPELRISESRVVLLDGSVMNFAKDTLHVRDLFEQGTYNRLVASREQDVVVWGDWRMSRSEADQGVALERDVVDDLRLRYESLHSDASEHKSYEKEDEVALEYFLSDSDSLTLELKEDEEFIGIQKKASF